MIENKRDVTVQCTKRLIKHHLRKDRGHENADDKECFFIIGTALHWVIDCIDRIPDTQIKEEHKKLFSGLRFANKLFETQYNFYKSS